MLQYWRSMPIRGLRTSLLIQQPRICCIHTSPQTCLKRYEREVGAPPTLDPFGEPPKRNMPPPAFSVMSVLSRSAREARERRRDGLPPVNDAPHVRKVYDIGCRNVIYAVQWCSNAIGIAACLTGFAYVIGYTSRFESSVPNIMDGTEATIPLLGGIFLLCMSHVVAMKYMLVRIPLRIYHDRETSTYKIVQSHSNIPLRSSVTEIPQYSCSKVKPSQYNFMPWSDGIYRMNTNGKIIFLFPDQFSAPNFFNNLLKD